MGKCKDTCGHVLGAYNYSVQIEPALKDDMT